MLGLGVKDPAFAAYFKRKFLGISCDACAFNVLRQSMVRIFMPSGRTAGVLLDDK